MIACAGSEGRSVPRTSGCSEKAAGRPRPTGSHLLPGGPHHPLAPRSPGSPDSEPSPGPARPGTSFLHRTHLTRHGCSRRGRGRPGRRVPEGRPGWEPEVGCGGSPGRGWVPQRRFQLFRCLKLAPAERCGHVTERHQSAPACLRVPAPNARRPEERRPRPGGRVRRSPGLEGRREGRAGGGQRAAPPRLLPGSLRGRLPSGAAHVTLPVGDPLGQPWSPVQPSVLRGPGCGCSAPSSLEGDWCSFTYRTDFTEPETRWQIGTSLPGAHRLVEREHGMR